MVRPVLVFLLALAALPALPMAAQDPTPEPGPEASKMLPDADDFGTGWSLTETVSPDILARYSFEMTPDVFREGAAGVYVGPDGSRVVVVSLLVTENRVAIRRSWEDATDLLDEVDSRLSTDYEREEALETMAPPDGCVEAKRVEGTEDFVLLPAAATMCAIDPDAILIAVVLGGVGGQTGVEASDAVIGLALGAEPGGGLAPTAEA